MSDFYRKKDPGQDRDLMIVDEWSFNGKNEKNKSVINFYSDRPSDTGAHNVSSGIITDLKNNIPQLSKMQTQNDEKKYCFFHFNFTCPDYSNHFSNTFNIFSPACFIPKDNATRYDGNIVA